MNTVNIPYMDITYKEVCNMKFLYTSIHEWLMLNEYQDMTGDIDHRFLEILYFERRMNVKEMRIWWRSFKAPQGSKYFRYRFRIDSRVINVVDFEILRNGKKMKAQDGEVTIEIHPQLQLDYQNQWEKNWFLKYFDQIFRTRIFHENVHEHRRQIYREAYRLHGFIKKYLELKVFTPQIEVFHERFDRL